MPPGSAPWVRSPRPSSRWVASTAATSSLSKRQRGHLERTTVSEISRVGVVGAGLMGSGIAEVCARAGLDVVINEVNREALDHGRQRIEASLARGLKHAKLTAEERDAALSRMHFSTDLGDFADRHLVIEAVIENEQAK